MLSHCPSYLESWVDREFKRATAGVARGGCCRNPVTGDWFVFGHDPISVQKKRAMQAQQARWLFKMTKPGDFPDLPLDSREFSSIMYGSPVDWLVVQYARSSKLNDYDLGHPDLATYAGGLRASGLVATSTHVADFIRAGVEELLERFPPRPLHGLDEWFVWHQQPHPRTSNIPRRSHERTCPAAAAQVHARPLKHLTPTATQNEGKLNGAVVT
jgi:hypothetical protein